MSSAVAAATEGHFRRAIDGGLPPAAVADAVADAIQQDRYWVFPQQEFLDLVAQRFATIAERLDPKQAGQVPGMPPRSQIDAEIRAVLGLTAPS